MRAKEFALDSPLVMAAPASALVLAVLLAIVLGASSGFLYVLGFVLVLLFGALYPTVVLAVFLFCNLLIPKIPLIEIQGYIVPIRIEDVFLVCALLSLLLRYLIYRERPAGNPLLKWMVIFSVVTGLSYLFGLFILGTVPGAKIGFLFWLRTPEYFAATYLCLLGVSTWKQYRQVIVTLVAITALIGVYGILQELSLVPIFDAMHHDNEIVTIRFFPGFGEDRLFSTFAGPYDLAAFYLIAIPVLIGLLLLTASRVAKLVIAAVIALSFFCFYLTYARAPLAALVVVLGVCLWLLGKRGWGVFLGALCFFPALLFGGFVERLRWAADDPLGNASLGLRMVASWTDALSAASRSPLLGTGPASLTLTGPNSLVLEGVGVDGLYFMLLGMWGVAGTLSFLLLIHRATRCQRERVRASRNKMQRALAIGLFAGSLGLLIYGFVGETFFFSKIAFSYWFLMGLLFAGNALEKRAPIDSANSFEKASREPSALALPRGS
jgi:hypothetical protein